MFIEESRGLFWLPTRDIADTKKLKRQIEALPEAIRPIAYALLVDIEENGPHQVGWPRFSSLNKSKAIPGHSFHCHQHRGRPTYVACWCINDKKKKIIEVYYVGTHENAPY